MSGRSIPPIPAEDDPNRAYYEECMSSRPFDLVNELSEGTPVTDEDGIGASRWLEQILAIPDTEDIRRHGDFYAERRVALSALVHRLTDTLSTWPALAGEEV